MEPHEDSASAQFSSNTRESLFQQPGPAAVQRVSALIDQLGSEFELDVFDLVHDALSKVASQANNDGADAQAELLVVVLGEAGAEAHLRELVEDTAN